MPLSTAAAVLIALVRTPKQATRRIRRVHTAPKLNWVRCLSAAQLLQGECFACISLCSNMLRKSLGERSWSLEHVTFYSLLRVIIGFLTWFGWINIFQRLYAYTSFWHVFGEEGINNSLVVVAQLKTYDFAHLSKEMVYCVKVRMATGVLPSNAVVSWPHSTTAGSKVKLATKLQRGLLQESIGNSTRWSLCARTPWINCGSCTRRWPSMAGKLAPDERERLSEVTAVFTSTGCWRLVSRWMCITLTGCWRLGL